MKKSVIAIFGRPNVGKSTLFNILTKSRDAIVDSKPGVTRDRHYGSMTIDQQKYIIIDTGGFSYGNSDVLQDALNDQVDLALAEADLILWVVDARSGCLPEDRELAQKLRVYQKQVLLCANKSESLQVTEALQDFYVLGYKQLCSISSAHKHGIDDLLELVVDLLPSEVVESQEDDDQGIKLAIIGRPNVGKSTFVNALLNYDRMIVSDISGTTRDSIDSALFYKQQQYTLIDTAGVRKKSKVLKRQTEGFSVIKTLQSVEKAHVVIVMCDSNEGVTDQDCQLINYVVESGRALLIVLNKSDCINQDDSYDLHYSIDRRLNFINFSTPLFCSAKNKKGMVQIMKMVKAVYLNGQKTFSTSQLTKWLMMAQVDHQPPMINSRRIKLRFAHMSKGFPPYVVIHGKQIEDLPNHYKKYLENSLRETFSLQGIPVRLTFKQDVNPYV